MKEDVVQAEETIRTLKKEKKALKMRLHRMEDRQDSAVSKALTFSAKEKGVIVEPMRDVIRNLTSLQVPVEKIPKVLSLTAKSLGMTLVDDIAPRSVSRITREGLVYGELQLMSEMNNAQSASPNTHSISP